MTFSIVGRCGQTGMFGVAITTSSICVGARCPHARAGVGAVASQNITNPALGPDLLDRLERGQTARQALGDLLRNLDNADFRQLLVIDNQGNTACHTGRNILGIHAQAGGSDCFAAGNLLANEDVPSAMTGRFADLDGSHLGERLLDSLQAGLNAGGEMGNVHSAALLVVDAQPFPLVDLRVDWDDQDPVRSLWRLWRDYRPQMQDYLVRAIRPADAPSYGVPGDP